jgi:perosamine synthetase
LFAPVTLALDGALFANDFPLAQRRPRVGAPMIRRQLPVRSPLTLAAALAPLGRSDPRPTIRQLLEEEFPERTAVLTSSGTGALQLALELAVGGGDGPVAMPGYACFDLATAALGAGVRVRLYDLDPHTLQPDLESLARAVGTDARAVVVVHLYGLPVPLDSVRAIAARSGAVLIEDAAQGTGASVGGAPVGGAGDLGVLSFGRGKGVTGGGGGALLASDRFLDAAKEIEAALATRGAGSVPPLLVKGLAQWLLARPAIYGIPSRIPLLRLGETIYHEPTQVTAMAPAVARTLLHTWRLRLNESRIRAANAERLNAALAAVSSSLVIQPAEGTTAGWLRLPLLIPNGCAPGRRTAAALGIVPAYPISLEDLVPFRSVLLPSGDALSGSRQLAARLWTLPTHGALGTDDLKAIESWICRVLGTHFVDSVSNTTLGADAPR